MFLPRVPKNHTWKINLNRMYSSEDWLEMCAKSIQKPYSTTSWLFSACHLAIRPPSKATEAMILLIKWLRFGVSTLSKHFKAGWSLRKVSRTCQPDSFPKTLRAKAAAASFNFLDGLDLYGFPWDLFKYLETYPTALDNFTGNFLSLLSIPPSHPLGFQLSFLHSSWKILDHRGKPWNICTANFRGLPPFDLPSFNLFRRIHGHFTSLGTRRSVVNGSSTSFNT